MILTLTSNSLITYIQDNSNKNKYIKMITIFDGSLGHLFYEFVLLNSVLKWLSASADSILQ